MVCKAVPQQSCVEQEGHTIGDIKEYMQEIVEEIIEIQRESCSNIKSAATKLDEVKECQHNLLVCIKTAYDVVKEQEEKTSTHLFDLSHQLEKCEKLKRQSCNSNVASFKSLKERAIKTLKETRIESKKATQIYQSLVNQQTLAEMKV